MPDEPPTPPAPRRRVALMVLGGVALLALVETVAAVTAFVRAPTDADWRAAAAEVRAAFKDGDLIVAAPAWADPVLRLHLGDLVPRAVAGRMDAARFPRIWEVAQRGARAPEADGLLPVAQSEHGRLVVRRYERPALVVRFDFAAAWNQARVSRVDAAGVEVPCPFDKDHLACPGERPAHAFADTSEVDFTLRLGLHVEPPPGAILRIEYPAVPLGRELVLGTGLHHVWLRKAADGVVDVRVFVDGQPAGRVQAGSGTGWTLTRIDTAAAAGRTVPVRFEVSSPRPASRQLALAAEARG